MRNHPLPAGAKVSVWKEQIQLTKCEMVKKEARYELFRL